MSLMRGKSDSSAATGQRGEFEATVAGQKAYGAEHRSMLLALTGRGAEAL